MLAPSRTTSMAGLAGSPWHRRALACGIAGPLVFNATYLVEGAARHGYDPVHQTISELSLGRGGWTQMANFIVFGLFLAVFGVAGLLPALVPGRGMTAVPLLQLTTAVSLVIAGVCVMDPAVAIGGAPLASSLHGAIHNGVSFIALTARIGGCVVLAGRFLREPGWRAWAICALVTAVAMVVFLSAFGSAQSGGGAAGLYERLATGAGSLFTVALACRLLVTGGRVAARDMARARWSKAT